MKPLQDCKRASAAGRTRLGFLARGVSLSMAVAVAGTALLGSEPASAAAPEPLGSNGEYSLTGAWDLFPYYSPGDIEVIPATGEVFVWDNLGIERLSPSGQLLERFDGLPDGSTAVDPAGNLAIAERYSDVPQVRTVSPSGQLISVLTIPDLAYAGPLATLGNSIWVGVDTDQGVAVREYVAGAATGRTIPIADARFLISPGFWYGDNMAANAQGNLVLVVQPTAEGVDPLVRTYSPDGRLLSEWSWPPSAPDALPHSRGPGALAVNPEGLVLLLGDDGAGGKSFLEVFSPAGSLHQRINLTTLQGLGRPAGVTVDRNGRVYVTFTSYQEGGAGKVFLFDPLRSPSSAPLAWNAVACTPFEGRIEASGRPSPSWFELVNGSLPAGVKLDQSTGAISGTPAQPGQTSGSVRISNGVNPAVDEPFTFTVTEPQFNSAPAPTLAGDAVVGNTLAVETGAWAPAPEFTYQWLRDGQPLAEATQRTYTVTNADVGHTLSAKVLATGPCGRVASASTATVGPREGSVPTAKATAEPAATMFPTPETDAKEAVPTNSPAPTVSLLASTGLTGPVMLWLAGGGVAALVGGVLVLVTKRRRRS